MLSLLLRKSGTLGRAIDFAIRYRANRWGDSESRSGIGSRRDSPSVLHALRVLDELTTRLDIRSLVDIPCGDFNWIHAYLDQHPEVDYHGYDIVPAIVSANRLRFPQRHFSRLDIVEDAPARADLIFCKDLINHLEDDEIRRALENMRRSGSTWLLITNNLGHENVGLKRRWAVDTRHVDLMRAPFSFPPPTWHDHYLALWEMKNVPKMSPT